jgi:hypothetical protein
MPVVGAVETILRVEKRTGKTADDLWSVADHRRWGAPVIGEITEDLGSAPNPLNPYQIKPSATQNRYRGQVLRLSVAPFAKAVTNYLSIPICYY